MPEYDSFTLDTHCYVCHKQTTHAVQYKVDRRTVVILAHCPVCKAVSKCAIAIRNLAYMTIQHQWGPK